MSILDNRRALYHRTAKFYGPHFGAGGAPAIEIAGCLVVVSIDSSGRLVICADFDNSELGLGEKDITPVVVKMSGETVWEATVD